MRPAQRMIGNIAIPPKGFGLVFMGGGAKGAYQLGVWQALREMDVPICAVTGASIGSINGALLAQGDFDAALAAWQSVRMNQIVRLDGPAAQLDNLFDRRSLLVVAGKAIRERGLDNSPLRETLAGLINEEKVRASAIAYGLTTFSRNGLALREVFAEDIPRGQLIDYVLASACFPIFRSVHIGKEQFIDGGVVDNMPAGMLVRRGVLDILSVNIGGVGPVRRVRDRRARIIEIRHSQPLGGLFDLTPDVLAFNRRLGQLDTLKVFGQLQGKHYFFTPHQHAALCAQYTRPGLAALEQAALMYGLPADIAWSAPAFRDALLIQYATHQAHFETMLEAASFESMVRELRAGYGLAQTLGAPLRLHLSMRLLAMRAGRRWVRPLTAMIPRREWNAAQGMLMLVYKGGLAAPL